MRYLVFVVLLALLLVTGCGHPTEEGLLFKTADPNFSIGFRWASPPTVGTDVPPPIDVAPDVVPEEEVGEVVPEPPPTPPCGAIKGNISKDGRKLYHEEGMPNYPQVKINEEVGERWFCSVEEAEEAGWERANN